MNFIYGTSANNVLYGTTGEDTIFGLAGNDTLKSRVLVNNTPVGGGNDILVGGDGNDALEGGHGADSLDGGNGNDHLDGVPDGPGAAIDTLVGGAGDDVYLVDAGEAEVLVEDPGGGNDTVVVLGLVVMDGSDLPLATGPFTYTLPAEFENVLLHDDVGNPDDFFPWIFSAIGNSVANLMSGNGAANTLSGLGGNDTLLGYGGNDTLDGGAGNDSLIGGVGNDVLQGGRGENLMLGGTGNDAYYVKRGDGAGVVRLAPFEDQVVEALNAGTDTVHSGVYAYALEANVENLVLEGIGRKGFGNGLNNELKGNGHANTLEGGAGNDTLLIPA